MSTKTALHTIGVYKANASNCIICHDEFTDKPVANITRGTYMDGVPLPKPTQKANAERIAACLNAMAAQDEIEQPKKRTLRQAQDIKPSEAFKELVNGIISLGLHRHHPSSDMYAIGQKALKIRSDWAE